MHSGNDILIIKLGALGDVILATPHIKRIVEACPDAQVTLMTAPGYAVLVQGHPGLEVVAFRRRGFIEMWRILAWLRSRRFAVVYDLQGSLRSRIMTRVSGARRCIARKPGPACRDLPPEQRNRAHVFQELNALLESAGIEPAQPRAWLSGVEEAGPKVVTWLKNYKLQNKRLVLIHAGCSRRWPSKRWEEAHYAALATALESRGFSVLWIGGQEEGDLNRRLARQAGVDASGLFTLAELVALGQRAEFALVNDSGPMHVLSAAPLPVYAFFGPTDWRCSHALGQEGRILGKAVPCSPCHLPVCPPEREHRCLRTMTPALVMSRLEEDGYFRGH